jgi:hypothetical protein
MDFAEESPHLAGTTCAHCRTPIIYETPPGAVLRQAMCPRCAVQLLVALSELARSHNDAALTQLGAALEFLAADDARGVRRRIRAAIRKLETATKRLRGERE